ncbi:MAG: hypothetical protein RR490_08495 [Niameybacter sp.]
MNVMDTKFLKESPCKGLTVLAILPGIALYTFIMCTSKNTVMKKVA